MLTSSCQNKPGRAGAKASRSPILGKALVAALFGLGFCGTVHAQDLAPDSVELFGELELEGTVFFRDPQFVGQDRDSVSFAGQATFLAEWADGDIAFRFTPFARYDIADDRRTHADIRELKFDIAQGNWSFTIGADTVFWGKTEVVHLVDIINQTDQVEDLDDEDRLGQPMLRVSYLAEDIGEFSAFVLPFFRERTFPGVSGRLRTNPPVNTALPIFDTDAEEWTPSFALRYDGVFGDVDLGVSAFHGLGRDPAFFFDGVDLRPFYERITQVGVDVQYTTEATLWKGEAIWRGGQKNARFQEEDFVALTGGVEYTLFGVAESNADLGLIVEYAWDSRRNNALTTFQNDIIGGVRLALNDEEDTAILLTGSVDVNDGSSGLRLEADRRIAEDWTLGIEGQAFLGLDRGTPAGAFADDSFLRAKLTYFFGVD
ncbi:MAG: hypothetical protein AAF557_06395 [Pseudomonadota bacterium]